MVLEPMMTPVIALIGRPNVGKSTLFNHLTRTRDALVAAYPGLTRDRQYGICTRFDCPCLVVDTGGLTGSEDGLDGQMAQQAKQALAEADLALFLVDAKAGLTPGDEAIAEQLRTQETPALVVVNKVDGEDSAAASADFFALGLGEPCPISAIRGSGIKRLMTEVVAPRLASPRRAEGTADGASTAEEASKADAAGKAGQADKAGKAEGAGKADAASEAVGASKADKASEADAAGKSGNADRASEADAASKSGQADKAGKAEEAGEAGKPSKASKAGKADKSGQAEAKAKATGIKLAIVGRPNVGKSTLVNRLLGEARVLTNDEAGTTRDSIYIPFKRGKQSYTLIDTAGMRRKAKVQEQPEQLAVIKTLEAIADAEVALLLIDAEAGLVEQDLRLLSHLLDAGRALALVVNKWDAASADQKAAVKRALNRRLTFLDFASVHYISALHGDGLSRLYPAVDAAYASATAKLPTPQLNKILGEALAEHQPPLARGRRIRLRYAHQGGTAPPTVIIHGNQTSALPAPYRRYLAHRFIKALELQGTPLRLEFRTGENPFEGKKNPLSPSQTRHRQRLVRHAKQKKKAKRHP